LPLISWILQGCFEFFMSWSPCYLDHYFTLCKQLKSLPFRPINSSSIFSIFWHRLALHMKHNLIISVFQFFSLINRTEPKMIGLNWFWFGFGSELRKNKNSVWLVFCKNWTEQKPNRTENTDPSQNAKIPSGN
jgi:hypothetical protein